MIGSALSKFLRLNGHTVISLVRREVQNPATEISWQPDQEWLEPASIEGFDAVVHLAGENIADKRWNDERKKKIVDSRVRPTALLARGIGKLASPPKVFMVASAIGIYGSRADDLLTEDSAPGEGFLADTATQWEAAASLTSNNITRTVVARIGVVLTPNGGALAKMLPFFRSGLGGVIGSGEQYLSWIVLDDLIAAFDFLMQRDDLSGPFNLVAPTAVTNRDFTHMLARALGRPAVVPVPRFAIKAMYGEMGEATVLASLRVAPKRLVENGFTFKFPNLEDGLAYLLDSQVK